MRDTKSNIAAPEDEEDIDSYSEAAVEDYLNNENDPATKPPSLAKMTTIDPPSVTSTKRSGRKSTKEETETFALKSIGEAFALKATQRGSAKKDADGLFGEMVAEELRQVSGRSKIMLKHKIQTAIYECQMEAWNGSQPKRQLHMMSPPSTPSFGNSLHFNAYGSPVYQQQQPLHEDKTDHKGYYTNLLNEKQ